MGELAEWKDDDWDQLKNNYKKPDRISDPANPANLIHQTAFAISVKSLKCLKAASELIRYHESVSIELTATKIHWSVIENLRNTAEGNLLEDRADGTRRTKNRKDHHCCEME